MTTGVTYPNPPIREAVFDIRIKSEKIPELEVFEKAYEVLKDRYPKREVNQLRFFSFQLQAGEKPVQNSGGGPNGLRLTSADGKQIVQLRNDGFTFSRLQPYTRWDVFSAEVKNLLEIYISVCGPLKAERIALRYINAIQIPEKRFELGDYFHTYPHTPKDVKQDITQFFSRIIFTDEEKGINAGVNQTMEGNSEGNTIIIFDLDVFKEKVSLDINSDEFWKEMEELKTVRTNIFQESLTEKTKALFA